MTVPVLAKEQHLEYSLEQHLERHAPAELIDALAKLKLVTNKEAELAAVHLEKRFATWTMEFHQHSQQATHQHDSAEEHTCSAASSVGKEQTCLAVSSLLAVSCMHSVACTVLPVSELA